MAVARPSLLLAAFVAVIATGAPAAAAGTGPTASGAPATVLRTSGALRAAPAPPAGTVLLIWRDVSRGEVDPRSDAYVPSIDLDGTLHADFGSGHHGDYGILLTPVARIVAGNGSDRYVSRAPDVRWDDDDLDQLEAVRGRAFEVVRSGPLVRPGG